VRALGKRPKKWYKERRGTVVGPRGLPPTFMISTEDEQGRIAALGRYGILDTPAEAEFDRITALAARLFRVPTVAIVLVDGERTWSKSRYGLALPPTPRALAFCNTAIEGPDVFVVPDASADPRFSSNPLVTREPGVRFYAGAPICTPEGHTLGCLELVDYRARELSSAEREMLANLSAVVMDELELRAAVGRIRRDTSLSPGAGIAAGDGAHLPAFREVADVRLGFVTHQLPAIIWTTDRDLHISSAIGAGLESLGIDPARVVGLALAHVLANDDPRDALVEAHRRAALGEGVNLDWSARGRVWHCWVEPLRDPDGSVVGAIGIALDISERARLEKAVLDRDAHVVQNDRLASLGTLAAGVAHEINNPLTYVITNIGYVSERLAVLADDLAAPTGKPVGARMGEIREALAEAEEGAQRVRKIVRDLRTYSRGDDEQEKTVDIWRVLEWSVNMTMNEIRHRARLVKDLGPIPGVRGTDTRLGQVFINLLVNAAQAMAAGSTSDNEIRISTMTDEDGRAVVCISDTGPGIAPDVLDHIFEPFFTTKPTGVGLGLGLFVCHGIIKSMGGTLTAESPPGAGATFVVTLPPASPNAPVASDVVTASVPKPRRARVLAVDDEPQVLRSIQRALGAHEVIVADCGREALLRLETDAAFDVILCDLMMGDMTGMDLHAEVRLRSAELAGRIVFMTGGVFTDGARDFLASVSNACIEKPFDLAVLRAMVAARSESRAP
jgi:signal transduction histidine kinase/ActR/RegA family two-component response regulator